MGDFGERAQYYKHSGGAPPFGVAMGVGVGMTAGMVLAPVYAYLLVYNPFIYVSAIGTLAFGGIVGLAVARGLHQGKVRSTLVSAGVTIAVLCVAFYLSWAVWVYGTFSRGDVEVALVELFNPLVLWSAVSIINEHGAWSLSSTTPTGAALWFFWAVEAAIIFGAGLVVGLGNNSAPFCEPCGAWCEELGAIANVGDTLPHETVKGRLAERDLSVLEDLGPIDGGNVFVRVQLSSCAHCNQLNTLTVEHVTITHDDKGEPSETTAALVDKLLVGADEAQWLLGIEQRQQVLAEV